MNLEPELLRRLRAAPEIFGADCRLDRTRVGPPGTLARRFPRGPCSGSDHTGRAAAAGSRQVFAGRASVVRSRRTRTKHGRKRCLPQSPAVSGTRTGLGFLLRDRRRCHSVGGARRSDRPRSESGGLSLHSVECRDLRRGRAIDRSVCRRGNSPRSRRAAPHRSGSPSRARVPVAAFKPAVGGRSSWKKGRRTSKRLSASPPNSAGRNQVQSGVQFRRQIPRRPRSSW